MRRRRRTTTSRSRSTGRGRRRQAAVQTIFLDFDGAAGQHRHLRRARACGSCRRCRPSSAAGASPAAQENALINRDRRDGHARTSGGTVAGLNGEFGLSILNSRDHADPFGQPNVSRLIVGGTIAESGIDTIGIAQSIDPGNFETEETALILLDVVSSDPAGDDASFNTYLTPASDRVRFVGTALGNIASHEAGHFFGNFHVDQFNAVLNLMDQGGNFPLLYGVGPDGIGGTADDADVDFGEDILNPGEGFTGIENTAARTPGGCAP